MNCTEQAMPSSAKRPMSSGARHWACSMRCRSPSGCPGVACRLERVERLAVGPVADRVHRHGPARCGAGADDLGQLLAARDHDARPVEQPRRLRPERAVHERLQVAEPQEVVAEAGRSRSSASSRTFSCGQRLPDPQREPFPLVDATEDGRARRASRPCRGSRRRRGCSRSAIPTRVAFTHSSSETVTNRSRNCHADSSRRTPVGAPSSSRSTTPPGTWRSPSASASAAVLSQSEW